MRRNCNCKNKQHDSRELASGAFSCRACNQFIECQEDDCASLAEFVDNGRYACQKHNTNKNLKEYSMGDAMRKYNKLHGLSY